MRRFPGLKRVPDLRKFPGMVRFLGLKSSHALYSYLEKLGVHTSDPISFIKWDAF